MEIRKIAVFGSNSFTGSHFISYILENTDAEVIGISRSPEYDPILLPYLYQKKERPKKFKFYQLDLNKDIDEIMAILDEEKPDVVVNYSAQGEVRNSWKWPEQWFQTNCLSVVRLANRLKDRSYLKRYVSISTPEVYGSTEQGMKEGNNFQPSTPYAASKLAGDMFLFTLFKRYNFPVIFTRSSNVYGIHQQLYRIIPRTIIYLKSGKKIKLHGGGKVVRSFIHVKDVSDATWRAINYGRRGEVYHVAPDEQGMEIRQIVEMICEMMGYNFNDSTEILDEDFGQDQIYSLDASKAKKELGWSQKIRFMEGIEEMIPWIKENFDKVSKMPLDYVHKE